MAKWVLIDGFNLAFRAFHAVPGLKRADGFPTNAAYGWVRTLWRLEDEEGPEGRAIFYDLGGAARRESLLPSYKAQRAAMPTELEAQIPWLKRLAGALGWTGIERFGVESDDLLASHARRLAAEGHEVWIASGDKDFGQVVDERVRLLVPPPSATPKAGWKRLDAAGVEEKCGVPPALVAEYLALMGDAVDNIPGVPGVGPKTAAKWLREHGSLEGVLAAADRLEPARLRPAVTAAASQLRLNLQLTALELDLATEPLALTPRQPAELQRLLLELEMRSHAAEAEERHGGLFG